VVVGGIALGGSFASSLYGEARATRDVDLVAAVAGRQAAPIITALGPEFYADEAEIAAAATHQGSFNLIHRDTMAKVDVFVVWRTDFGRAQLARRRHKQVGSAEPLDIFVTSAEDTILAKLDWFRKGGESFGPDVLEAGDGPVLEAFVAETAVCRRCRSFPSTRLRRVCSVFRGCWASTWCASENTSRCSDSTPMAA